MAKHIEFIKARSTGIKTRRWLVLAKADGYQLGVVKWFARWYQYAFFPTADTVFEKTCLRDIAQFCNDETVKKRATWGKKTERRLEA